MSEFDNVTPMRSDPALLKPKAKELLAAATWAGNFQPSLDRDYLVKGWLDKGTLTVVFGPSNVGKSFFALDLAHHISKGEAWGNRRVNKGNVLYIAAEGGSSFPNRVSALDDPEFWVIAAPVTFAGKASDAASMVEMVQHLASQTGRFDMIVVDTLSRVMGDSDENTAPDIADLVRNLDVLRRGTGSNIMLIHHSGKDVARGARGHSSLRAAVDTVLDALSLLSGPICIRLNSGGGIAFDGTAIHSVLSEYPGHKTVVVQGIAASAASVIMMAGDRIEMSAGSILMIHDPSQDITSYRGTSEEHRRIADSLDKISGAVAQIYAQRSGKPIKEIRQIMAAESWFTPEEAVAAGFADTAPPEGEQSPPAEFDYRAYAHSPSNLIQMAVQNHWINDFSKVNKMANQSTAQTETAEPKASLPSSLAPVMGAVDRSDPRKELKRVKELTSFATTPLAQRIDALARLDGWINEGVTLDAARHFVTTELAALTNYKTSRMTDAEYYGKTSVGQSWEGGEGLNSKIVDGIYSRVNRAHQPTLGREFAGASLSEIADICLQQSGKSTAMASVASRVEMALHGTSDFPNILRDVGNMSLSHAYEAAQSAIKQTSREIAASNFRALHSVKVSAGPDLEEVNEHGEFKSGTVEEGAETFAVKTYGKIFGITRQAIVNDDLEVFSNMFPLLGQGAANTEAKLFAGLLEENAGLGPKLSDGKTLFHADHGNLGATASALSVASLGAARVAMRRQTGIAGEATNVVPAFLVVPPELETLAEQVLTEIAASEVANANPFAGKLKLLVEPRFTSATAWYLCAAPGAPDSLQHAYLDGVVGPQLFTREGFEVDGVEYKVRMDFGAGFTDHRGWYMSPSA